jgi:CubicO group peptidase (beta-lactamase class C family)
MTQDPIRVYLQHLVDDGTIAGAVYLVGDRDQTLYLQAVGYRDLEAKEPLTADTMFWIASTTKPMTATALMMLVDEGKVRLDDPIEKYLPEFKGQKVMPQQHPLGTDSQMTTGVGVVAPLLKAAHPIRVREVLSHTSGLPFRSLKQPGALDLLPLQDQVKSFAAEPLLFQPGTDFSYSNEGFNTAARIIEVVSGESYEQFLQERIFDPLGMKETTFWPNAAQIARLAKSYKLDPVPNRLVATKIDQLTYPLEDRRRRFPVAAGGLFSTAADVQKFCRMILNGGVANGHRLISEASLREMTTQQNGQHGDQGYGLGWTVSGSTIGHGGAYKNTMEIDRTAGRIFLLMVQQSGDWGTSRGNSLGANLDRMGRELVKAPAER